MGGTVHIVHCVDCEGPLYESMEATFERLNAAFGLRLEPDRETLIALREGQVKLGGLEEGVRTFLDPKWTSYYDSWDKIDGMLSEALSSQFRRLMVDSKENGWIYNWFCMDHVDCDLNPRRRDMGYHNIFDHYASAFKNAVAAPDGIHFHFHPHSFLKDAHLSGTHWWGSSNKLHQILARRIIDRQWFPRVNRPGFFVTRPDSHWFLEQFIPFDLSNLSADEEDDHLQDFERSRFGDWNRAPRTWEPYHPSHDDYQKPGTCRRWIARCLNIGARSRNLSEGEVNRAFLEAREGKPVVMAFADHDFLDIRPDQNRVRSFLRTMTRLYPDVNFEFCEAADAMRRALSLPDEPACELDIRILPWKTIHVLMVRTTVSTFGPQPFFAIKTLAQSYHHDNFDFQRPGHEWTYVLDEDTFPLKAIEKIGVAVNNASGKTTVALLDVATGTVKRTFYA